jgi:ribosome-associated toxin RatA of RatAB toxin-antitoxin module
VSVRSDTNILFVALEVDFGWYAPRLKYVFRADVVPDQSIAFRQVSGDFKANEGIWEFEPAGARTLLRYRVHIDPPGYIPNWLARSTFKRELPQMLANLKRHCEAEQVLRAQANTIPY